VTERPAEPSEDARELADLAAALEAHVKRRRAAGVRRVAQRETLESESLKEGRKDPPARPQAPAFAASSRLPDKWVVPAPPPGAAARSAPSSAARSAAESLAKGVRDQANACKDLEELRLAVAACTACGLCRTRTQTVFSDGSRKARLLFVGEAPGAEEDARGVPFVGRAGALLTDILTKGMGLARADVYIANVLKCRPPDNRDPSEAEKLTCTPWLDRQIELVDPAVIIPLGRHAANHVLGTDLPMAKLRGQVFERNQRKVVPTFHPAYLLRSPSMKKECWKDIQLAMGVLGLKPPHPRSI
jgi:uracil-DNA glycosylase